MTSAMVAEEVGDMAAASPHPGQLSELGSSVTTTKSQGWVLRDDGARRPASRIRSICSAGMGDQCIPGRYGGPGWRPTSARVHSRGESTAA